MVTGVLAWLLVTVMMKSGSDAIVAALFTLAACAVLPLALERLLVSAVLAVCPWREINGTPEEVALRREAAYAERAELRRERRKRRVVDAIFICTVLLQGAKGGALVATVGVLMLAISLGRKQKPAVLALYAAVAAAGLLGYLQVMSTVASMALNVLAATTANAAILQTEE